MKICFNVKQISILLLFILIQSASIYANIFFVEGSEQANFKYSIPSDLYLKIPDYRNVGFNQTISSLNDENSLLVKVEVSVSPSNCATSDFSLPVNNKIAPKFYPSSTKHYSFWRAKSISIAKNRKSLKEVVSAMMIWINNNMSLSNKEVTQRKPFSALQRAWGNCVDFSNIAFNLLSSIGIKCRIVHGLIIKNKGAAEFHRWIEVFFPKSGWYFYDPTYSFGFVPSNFIVLFIEDSNLPFSNKLNSENYIKIKKNVHLVNRKSSLFITDCISDCKRNMLSRRCSVVQLSSCLWGKIVFSDGKPLIEAELIINKSNSPFLEVPLNDFGIYSVPCISPGNYSIILKYHNTLYPIQPIKIENRDGKRVDYYLKLN